MNTQLITTEEELVSLKDSWNGLIKSNSETDRPFFSWDWFYYSWRHFGKPANQKPAVITVEDNEKLIGILPLVSGTKMSSEIFYRTWEFCNPGIIPRNTLYFDSVQNLDSVIRAVGQRIFEEKKRWDLLELKNIPQSSRFHDYWLNPQTDISLAVIQTRGLTSPHVLCEGSYEEYFSKYGSKDARRRSRRNIERFTAENKSWGMKIFETENEIQQGIDLALEVRKNSWKGHFSNEAYIYFYRELFTELARRNEVLIPILMLDEIPLAAEFITGSAGNFFLHTNDYNQQFRETSPGTCLLHFVLQQAFERHWKMFDFTGDDYDYKKDWSNGVCSHSTFQIFHNRIKSKFLYSAKTFWLPLIRRILKKPEPDDLVFHAKRY